MLVPISRLFNTKITNPTQRFSFLASANLTFKTFHACVPIMQKMPRLWELSKRRGRSAVQKLTDAIDRILSSHPDMSVWMFARNLISKNTSFP